MIILENVWKKLMQNTLNGVFELIDSAEKLLSNEGNTAICGGLYTFAVEEYGKLVLLKTCVPSNGSVEINDEWFGKRTRSSKSHSPKFEAAMTNLPDECKILSEPIWEKGLFAPGIWNEETVIANFEARKAIFYCDLNDSHDDIKPVPIVYEVLLKRALPKLRTISLETTIP